MGPTNMKSTTLSARERRNAKFFSNELVRLNRDGVERCVRDQISQVYDRARAQASTPGLPPAAALKRSLKLGTKTPERWPVARAKMESMRH